MLKLIFGYFPPIKMLCLGADAQKGGHFVQLCDNRDIPILFLQGSFSFGGFVHNAGPLFFLNSYHVTSQAKKNNFIDSHL